MPKFSVKKPFTVLVGVILVLVLGVVSVMHMSTDLLPTINLPYLIVVTTYPGASPEKVESDVTEPLESALGTVNGVENVTSTSSENYSMVMLEFAEDTDMDSAMVKATTELNQLADTLPDMAGTPTLMEISADMMATQYVAVDYEGMDIYQLSDYVENEVIPAIERIDGVASVSATGLVEKTVKVTLQQDLIDEVNDKLLVQVSDRLDEAKKQLDDAQAQVDEGKAGLTDGKTQLESGKAALQTQQDNIGQQLNEAIASLNEAIPGIEDQVEAMDGKISGLQTRLTDAQNGLNEIIDRLAAELAGLISSGQGSDSFATIRNFVTACGVDASGLPTGVQDAMANNGAKLNAMLDAVEQALDNVVDGSLADAQNTLSQAKLKLDAAQKEVDDGKAALAAAQQQADAMKAQVDELQAAYDAIADKDSAEAQQALAALQGAQSGYETLTAQLAEAQTRLETSQTALTAAQAAYDTARQALDTLQLQAGRGITIDAATRQEIGSLLGELSTALTAMQGVQSQLDAANVDLSGLNSQLSQLNDYRGQLESALEGLEENPLDTSLGDAAAQLLFSGMSAQLSLGEYQMTAGETQLETAQTQLDAAREEYESAREEALKSANLDTLLNITTLSGILTAENFSMPAGYVQDGDNSYLLKVGDAYSSVDDLAGTLLCHMDGVGDVRLSDVATIEVTDNADESYAKVGGNQAVLLSIYKGSTASTSDVADACNAKSDELMAADPNLRLTAIMDQGEYIHLIVNTVLSNLIQGALLAIVVLIFFLKDFRPTLVVGISIPLSVLCALVAMYFSGISLNMISLSGLALGIGMLVDNSIVVIENIYRLRNRGIPAARAAVQGTRQVAGSIISSTVTTICVFLPMLFTTGLVRELMMDLALTITFSLLASLVVAMTVVPSAGSTVLKKTTNKPHPWFDRVMEKYDALLRSLLAHKVLPLAVAVVLLVGSVLAVVRQGFVLIPEISSNQMTVTVEMPEGTKNDQAYQTADQVMDAIISVDGVETAGAMSSGSAAGIMGMSLSTGSDANTSFTYYVILTDEGSRNQAAVREEITEKTAGLPCTVTASGSSMADMSSLMGSGVSVNIYGDDLDTLLDLSNQVSEQMGKIDGITDISNGQEAGDREVRVVVNKDEAMRLGLTVAQVYSELAQALTTETTSTTLTVGNETYTVDIVDTDGAPQLGDIFGYEFETTTTNADGETVNETHTLGEFATRVDAEGVAAISRENLSRMMTVSSTTADGYNTTLLANQVQQRLNDIEVPDGYSLEISGESTQVNDMLVQMSGMILLALVLIYLVMVAQFQSLLSPFIVMFTIPLAFTGGFLGLLISGQAISLMSMMGFLILMGVVVNNGIVFVDYANQLRLGGMERRDALVATGKTRMRPILMTTLTTVLSMVTMLFSTDPGSEMGSGMAVVIVGGLSYATLMTLFIVPIMYDIFYRKQPTVVDVGDEGMDDLPDDAAEFIAELEAKRARQPQTAPSAPLPGGDDGAERPTLIDNPYAEEDDDEHK